MIKCHFCKHELEIPEIDFDEEWSYMCPNGHASILVNDKDEIMRYVLYWDADPDANERYKLVATEGRGSYLYYSNTKRNRSWRAYRVIFETASFIPVTIKENTIQMDNLVMRLKRMGVFS